jgi:hypothetical protein
MVRAWALAQVGWLPYHTAAEGHALAMQLQAAGHKGAYLAERLVTSYSQRPAQQVLRQRSSWTLGHMQVGELAHGHC